ncbi:MAG TPA: 30S ribosomal protein S1 [Nitriliruptorales bacterium]|nr:30S ribosomal protein S1 [Nitriliruptorales bacterium]
MSEQIPTTTPEPTTAPGGVPRDPVSAVIMTDPGREMTSTGEQIVENDLDVDLDAAIEATVRSLNEGEIVEGVVVKVDPDEALLDIGYKSEGVIPAKELSIKQDVDPREVVQVGDVIEALVLTKEDAEGRLLLSKKRAQYERAWGTIERIFAEDKTVKGTVIEVVKGGLILDIGLRGFLPASLVEMRRVRDLHPYVGTELECKIIELDKNRNNVVLSRRKFLEETQAEFRQEFLNSLQKGEIRKGVVSSIVNFGAFVDLGGVDGLVHVSELSWQHIDHPSEVVEVGDEVNVEVLDVDLDRERVSLSLKATQEDPWTKFAREKSVGDVVEGEVTKLVPFGAFVKVAEGIEGLVHISELAEHHVEAPEAVVNVGDRIDVKVIDIDTVRRRISLSLKQVRAPSREAMTGPGALTPEQIALAETAYVAGERGAPTAGVSLGEQLRQAGFAHSAEQPGEPAAPAPSEQAAAQAAPEVGEPALEGQFADPTAPSTGDVSGADLTQVEGEVPDTAQDPHPTPEAPDASARAVARAPDEADLSQAEEAPTEEV